LKLISGFLLLIINSNFGHGYS
ncbi:uncharacterized protein METZ01_LOCUS129766, partial [marine metagenome]